MLIALLVSLICLEASTSPPFPVQISVVKHIPPLEDRTQWPTSEFSTISSTDAQCKSVACWYAPGCAVTAPDAPCGDRAGYFDVFEYGIQWGLYRDSTDPDGCINADVLPTPREGWIYFLRAAQ